MSDTTTIAQWVEQADAAFKKMGCGGIGSETALARAAEASAYTARAQLAVQLAERAGHTFKQLEARLRDGCQGAWNVIPTGDGLGAVVLLVGGGPLDGGRTKDMLRIWRVVAPWRLAGWKIDFVIDGRERCATDHHTPATHRAEETGLTDLPWCRYCGLVLL
jgi:hypothetical protein